MKIHHLGYAVKNIEKSTNALELLGYNKTGNLCIDECRMVKIQFMKNDQTCIELIEPIGDNSPVKNILKKNGEGPYHICYISENYDIDLSLLKESGYLVVENSKEAIALQNNRVAFLYKSGVGLIEVMENNYELND